ncbi:HTH-type transcriptional activator TipA [Rhizocola hellebori]|uniref:HTH-type transcriptional activator TipA n=1 Tax=Rhizocola hellebori TaxID=1392758 RepID=A0A8J3VJD9_9ACTN|nr:MerR family transcriptional regulator [Rhizocola hellebori]GIH07961.1 HTH-type transcriptional activator TipA [Rhizocola hellebori]
MAYPIGKVAELAGVTVRTLHHYDEIGLLSPSQRSATGYRRYDDADLERLQQILYYRELEFSLEEIAAIIDDPQADATAHLRRQHKLLSERIARLAKMVNAIEFAMEASKVGINLTPEERFEVWGGFDPDEHAQEAEQRWGDTDAYRESMRKTSRYTKQDWLRIKEQSEDWGRRIVAVMDAGASAQSPEAMELAEEHRQHISQWYYECSYEIQTGLAEMYLADERFMATYEAIKPGLTVFLHDAILANAVARS